MLQFLWFVACFVILLVCMGAMLVGDHYVWVAVSFWLDGGRWYGMMALSWGMVALAGGYGTIRISMSIWKEATQN